MAKRFRVPNKSSLQYRLEIGSIPEPNSGCWLWLRNFEGSGYPSIKYKGKNLHGNRVSWEVYRGPIPEGMCVLHQCDVRCCVNPDHLFLGTKKENADDMIRKGRGNRSMGERHSGSKLTENDVLEIRQSTQSLRKLARKYDVTVSTIGSVRKNRTWKHLNKDQSSC